MTRKEIAMDNFIKGYNCAQSVTLAFEDILEIDRETLEKVSLSFGGGIGRLREVCGCVSGMEMVCGLLYGYSGPDRDGLKGEHYKRVQELAHAYEEKTGSIVCRELLGLSVKHEHHIPEARTEEYYKKRPCKELIGMAAEILEDYIKKNPIA